MYGSSFCSVIFNPLVSSKAPIEADASPFPREESTPPVTKISFGFIVATPLASVEDFLIDGEIKQT